MPLIITPSPFTGNISILYKSSSSSSSSPLNLDCLPSDIIHILFETFDSLPQSTLHKLIQCSGEMYDRFAPTLYKSADLDKRNIRSFLAGLEAPTTRSTCYQHLNRPKAKLHLLDHTHSLTINDLPTAEYLSQALTSHSNLTKSSNPYFPTIHPSLFTSLDTLTLSPKAIIGLADIYNASSWGSSPFNIPSQPILRAMRYYLKPKQVILGYPDSVDIGLHLHSCIEEVVAYLSLGWDLDCLIWTNLNKAMVGPVPRSRKLIYSYSRCTHTVERRCSKTLPKGCTYHYDHISLTCGTIIDHIATLPFPNPEEANQGIELELKGLGCMFTLDWNEVVREVWSRVGTLDEKDWVKMDRWFRAKITLSSDV